MLRRFAGVRPGMRIIELGCGTGLWGRLLAVGLRGRGSLLGIDLDASLVARARALARAEGLPLARYRVGDAARTGLGSRSVDLATCHRLLCVVPEPERIVREMVRITRPRGAIVANEHHHGADPFFDPDDPQLRALNERRNRAFVKGCRRVAVGDHEVGSRVVSLFIDAGLQDIRLEGVLAPVSAHPFDARTSLGEARAYFEWLRDALPHLDPFRARVYRAGGWIRRDERRYVKRSLATIERRLRGGDLRTWGRVSVVPRFVVRAIVPA